MTLQQQINEDLKQAMLAQDNVAKLALRAVKTALTESIKSQCDGSSGQSSTDRDTLTDAEVQAVIQRLAKRRRDAAQEYERAGQPDRADEELSELAILERYLPQQLSEEEIEHIVRTVISETGASTIREIGQVMSVVMPRTKGRADGKVVNQIARKLLSA